MFIKTIYGWILSLDSIGPTPGLNYEGRERYATFLGAIFTLAALTLSLFSNRNMFDTVVNNTSPSIYSQYQPLLEPMRVTKENLKFFIQFTYIDPATSSFKNINITDLPPIFIVNVNYNRTSYLIRNLTNEAYNDETKVSMLTNDCSSEDIFDNYNYYNFFSKIKYTIEEINEVKKNSLCLPKYINETLDVIKGGVESLMLILPQFYMSELSKKYKSKLVLNFIYQELVYDPDKYLNPFRLNLVDKYFPVDITKMTQIDMYIQQITGTKDLTKFIYPDETQVSFSLIHSFEEIFTANIDTYKDTVLNESMFFVIKKDPKQLFSTITYDSYEMLLSNIGGSLGIYMPIFGFLICYIIDPFYKSATLNKVYKFHTYKDDDDKVENLRLIDDYLAEYKSMISSNMANPIRNTKQLLKSDNISNLNKTDQEEKSKVSKHELSLNSITNLDNQKHEELENIGDNINNKNNKVVKIKNSYIQLTKIINKDADFKHERNNSSNKLNNIDDNYNDDLKNLDIDKPPNNNSYSNYEANKLYVLENKITNKIKLREKVQLNTNDMCNHHWVWSCCEKKGKNLLIENCFDYLDEIYEVNQLAKTLMKYKMFESLIFNKGQREIFKISSINIKSTDINQIKSDDGDDDCCGECKGIKGYDGISIDKDDKGDKAEKADKVEKEGKEEKAYKEDKNDKEDKIFPIDIEALSEDNTDLNLKLMKNYLNSYI